MINTNTMKTFKQFTEAKTKPITFAFGRFNPPHTGHLKLLDKVKKVAKGGEYKIYASQSQDAKKNPLSFKDKIKYMKAMYPTHAKHISTDVKLKTAFHIMPALYEQGYTEVNFVVGSDRMETFERLKIYDGDKSNKLGFYTFPDGINIISAGARDPDSEDLVSAMSASRLRGAAADGDLKAFMLGVPKGFKLGKELFNSIRTGMNMKAITTFREHVKLPIVSSVREEYVKGNIFNGGDRVCNVKQNIVREVAARKTNYIVDTHSKKHFIADLVPANA